MTDYRSEQSPIIDQGQREICAACAVTAAHEWSLQTALSIEDAHWQGKLRDPWDDEPTGVAFILPGLTSAGHARSASWPFNAPAWPGPPPAASLEPANRLVAARWRPLGAATIQEIRDVIPTGAVILCLNYVPLAWGGPLVHVPAGQQVVGKHAVLAVGDGPYAGHDTVMVRNSWGDGWGIGGYGYISDTYLAHYLSTAYLIDRQGLAVCS